MTRDELLDRYVADTLDEMSTAELAVLLSDPDFAAGFATDLLATGQFEQVGSELRRIGESGPADEAAAGAGPGTGGGAAPVPPTAATQSGWTPPPPSPPVPSPPIPYQASRQRSLFGEHHEQPVLRSAQQKSPVAAIVIAVLLLAGIGVAVIMGLNRKAPVAEVSEPIIAQVDVAEGSVQLTRDLAQVAVEGGTNLFEGDVLEVSQGSVRLAYVNEKTYLHIRAGSQIRLEDHGAGKRIRLLMGQLTAEAAPQPVGRPMVITTDHASATLVGTKVTVRAISRETLVEVSEGKVEVERTTDGERVEVPAGAWAMVDSEGPLHAWEFVAGVNLNGESETIDGNRWLSHAEATQQGLQATGVERALETRQAVEPPTGYVPETGVRNVLMTSIAAKSDRLSIKWPQPNGQYQVFVWIMEHQGNQARSLRLNLEEKLVGEELGKQQNVGEWNRFGPYAATITDGSLDVLMSADAKFQSHDPHLSGLALYRQSGVPPAAQPDAEPPPAEPPPVEPPPVVPPPVVPGAPEE